MNTLGNFRPAPAYAPGTMITMGDDWLSIYRTNDVSIFDDQVDGPWHLLLDVETSVFGWTYWEGTTLRPEVEALP